MTKPTNHQEDALHSGQEESWEAHIHAIASEFSYPPTHDLKVRVSPRSALTRKRPIQLRVAQGFAAIVLLLLIVSILVPSVRAGLLEVLQIGGVRIYLNPLEPSPTITESPAIVSSPVSTTDGSTATPATASPAPAFIDLIGETTLEGARIRAPFPILLPSHPDDLGLPDHVYLQNAGGVLVVLVWLQPGSTDQVRLSLHILGEGVSASKGPLEEIAITDVHGQRAVWTTGPYLLLYSVGNRPEMDFGALVEGHVLVWESDGLTYRLETDLSMEEAVKIAESLQ